MTVDLHEAPAKGRRRLRRGVRRRQPPPAGALTPGIVVATYNIHSCVGVDRRYDPLRVASVLRELKADVVGLQEVEVHRNGTRVDQGAFLAAASGLTIIAGQQFRLHRGRFANAVLTRLPVLAVRHIDLSVDGHEPRSAIDVDLDAGGRVLRVIATHFGLGLRERQQQTQRLLAILGAEGNSSGSDGILMMGDLNEWRGRRGGIPALERELGRAPAPRTFPSWCPILPLDRIYATTPAVLNEFTVHRSPLARLASDHLPLRASLAWPLSGVATPAASRDPALRRVRKTLSSRFRRKHPG